jgi:hypothetical protein
MMKIFYSPYDGGGGDDTTLSSAASQPTAVSSPTEPSASNSSNTSFHYDPNAPDPGEQGAMSVGETQKMFGNTAANNPSDADISQEKSDYVGSLSASAQQNLNSSKYNKSGIQ